MRPLLAALVLVPVLVACGSDDDATSGAGAAASVAGSGPGPVTGTGGASTTGAGGMTGSGAGSGTGGNVVTPNQSCTSPSPPFTAKEQAIVDLAADSWFAAPDSKIRPVCPQGADGCGNVIEAWSGGTFDNVHSQMLIFGGGHGDYSGNEVYAFDLATQAWTRLTDPSSPDFKSQDPLPDGNPVSRHSYDGISYITHADRMFAHGGARWQDGGGTGVSWAFDPTAKAWIDRQPANAIPLANCCDEASAYDPTSKRVYFHLTKSLAAYDWDTNAWVPLQDYGEPPFWPRYEVWGDKRAVVDSKRGLVWFFGAKLVLTYDITSGMHVTDDWITTGGTMFTNEPDVGSHAEQVIHTGGGEVITAGAPGVDYDTAADDLVAWVGGAPWILELDSKVWSQSNAAGGPAMPAQHGTYGRWRYVPRLNVFVLVNSVDEDVQFYKHTAGCGE